MDFGPQPPSAPEAAHGPQPPPAPEPDAASPAPQGPPAAERRRAAAPAAEPSDSEFEADWIWGQ
eukprot:3943585-Pyramimonas_sp.AAC.1